MSMKQDTHKTSIKYRMSLLCSVILWASAFVGIRSGLQGGYMPGPLALFRFSVASICMLFILPALPIRRRRIPWRDRFLLMGVGALGLGCYNLTLNHGEMTVSAGMAGFIVSLAPVATVLFAGLFLGESFSFGMLGGMFLSIFGVALIAVGKKGHLHFDVGILYMLVAAVICGMYSVMQKPFLGRYHALEVTAWVIWGCAFSLSLYFPSMIIEFKQAPLSATMSIVYLGIFPAAIGYIAWSYGLSATSASRAAGYLYFMPVFASILGWLVLGEVPALISLVGGSVVLLGVWIVSHCQRKLMMRDAFLG